MAKLPEIPEDEILCKVCGEYLGEGEDIPDICESCESINEPDWEK